jgi:hypothetical protein
MSRSGMLVTVKLMSEKADAETIFGSFTDGAFVIRVGANTTGYDSFLVNGWFQKDRSGIQMQECWAEITLVFDQQNVQGLVPTSGSDKYDPVYSLSAATEERPIEQHPRFKCFWAYNLYELVPLGGSASAVPAWAATDTNPNAIHAGYLWSRTPPPSPNAQHEYIQVQAATKPGRDAYLIPRPVVTSVIYYKSRNIATSDLVYDGQLKAPAQTYIYPNTQTCWLITGCSVAEASDDLMAVTTNYTYNAEGWDTDMYDLAT